MDLTGSRGRLLVVLSGLLFSFVACSLINPRTYTAGPYRGRVIDAETKEPVIGAVVLMYWVRESPGLFMNRESFLSAEETLTDEGGRFVVGRWPRISLIPGTWVSQPYIFIYQPGYRRCPAWCVGPPAPHEGGEGWVGAMQSGRAVFELPRAKTRQERLEAQGGFPAAVPFKNMPALLQLVNRERLELGLQPVGIK
ncbi:MAG TPA: hypothetical protein VGA18_02120 [Rhodothermales bacterium]